jgi:tetratricopeptide (TPR) repeat protein
MALFTSNRRWLRLLGLTLVLAIVAAIACPGLLARRKVQQARDAMFAARYSDAIVLLVDAESWKGPTGETAFLRARCFRQLSDAEQMKGALQQAAELGFDRKRLSTEQTLYLAQEGELDKVGTQLPILFLNGGDDLPVICEAFANGFLVNHQIADAVQILNAWIADFPEDPRPHAGIGLIHKKAGQFTLAATAFREALKRDPDRVRVRLQLSEVLMELHRFDETLSETLKVLLVAPENVVALTIHGQAQHHSGLTDDALISLKQAVKIEPTNLKAMLALAQLHNDMEMFTSAIELLQKCILEEPFNVDVRSAFGTALRGLGKTEEAKLHFQYCAAASEAHSRIRTNLDKISRDGQHVEARFETGELMMKYGSPAEATAWLKSVLRLEPSHVPAHQTLADHYRESGQVAAARKHEAAVQLLKKTRDSTTSFAPSAGSSRHFSQQLPGPRKPPQHNDSTVNRD